MSEVPEMRYSLVGGIRYGGEYIPTNEMGTRTLQTIFNATSGLYRFLILRRGGQLYLMDMPAAGFGQGFKLVDAPMVPIESIEVGCARAAFTPDQLIDGRKLSWLTTTKLLLKGVLLRLSSSS